MSTIYLYVKQHATTGLKYFGKTTKDPYTYLGSGKYWTKHIAKHGVDKVNTLNVWEFTDIKECTSFATTFSISNDIVESDNWANLTIEYGTDGGYRANNYFKIYNRLPKNKHSRETKQKISESLKKPNSSWRPIIIDAIYYPSITSACNALGVKDGSIRYWLKTGKAKKPSLI